MAAHAAALLSVEVGRRAEAQEAAETGVREKRAGPERIMERRRTGGVVVLAVVVVVIVLVVVVVVVPLGLVLSVVVVLAFVVTVIAMQIFVLLIPVGAADV